MMHRTILTILLTAVTMTAVAESILSGLGYTARVGYNIGGTMPLGMPATIRSLNKYTPRADFQFGVDAHKRITRQWGLLAGLHMENKAMKVDATVKNYHMEMTKGTDKVEGFYTGNLVTECSAWMFTVPVMATFSVGEKVMLKCGPYISYLISKKFDGYVYEGYLRQNTPIGTKVEMGDTEETRGSFDFSDKMRHVQIGIDLGVDWQIGNRFGAYADLQWGLNGIHKSSFKTIEQTLYPIYGTLGVVYRIK